MIKKWVKDKLIIIIIVLISITYICYGLFNLEFNGFNFLVVLGNSFVSLIIGLSLTMSLKKQGLKHGRESEIFEGSVQYFAETKESVEEHIDLLPNFCAYKSQNDFMLEQKSIIINAGLSYDKFKNGFYRLDKQQKKLEKHQIEAIKQAQKVKIRIYKSYELLSDIPYKNKRNNKNIFGEDETKYLQNTFMKAIVFRLIWCLICGSFVLSPIILENVQQAFWNFIQIMIWLLLGMIDYYSAYHFMTTYYRQSRIILKTEILKEFLAIVKNSKEKLNKYDENEEYEEFLMEKEEQYAVNNTIEEKENNINNNADNNNGNCDNNATSEND